MDVHSCRFLYDFLEIDKKKSYRTRHAKPWQEAEELLSQKKRKLSLWQ